MKSPIHLLSVNGCQFTAIDGGGAVRCVFLTNYSALTEFTITAITTRVNRLSSKKERKRNHEDITVQQPGE